MIRFLFILFFTVLFAGASAQLDHPNLKLFTHQSEVLKQEQTYYIYLPSTDDPEERFPVIYMLHGKSQTYDAWVKYGKAAEFADNYRCILVFVGGAKFSWFLDSPLMENSQFFTYISEELVNHIDSTYPTIAKKEGRSIMGLSMGGHGALLAAAKRPDLYVSASSLSGVLKITDHPQADGLAERLGPMEEFPERWAENSVYENAEAFVDGNVRLLFDCENEPERGLIFDNIKLHEKLTELSVPHIWRQFPGSHNWRYWRGHLQEHLNFHQSAMAAAQEQPKWTQHYFNRMSLFFNENAKSTLYPYPDSSVVVSLFGSSGIEGTKPEYLPETLPDGTPVVFVNRGISSDRLGIDERGLSKRMESSVFDFSPDVVVIANGTNDIGELHRSTDGHPTIDRMIEEYEKIVKTILERSPETKIVISACAPVRGRYAHLNDSIVEYNARTKKIAEDYGCTFVDIHTATVGEDGMLREDYSQDSLHFTPAAKQLWVDLIVQGVSDAITNKNIAGSLIPGFTETGEFGESVMTETLSSGVRLHYNAPANYNAKLKTQLILFALPNGNTIEQTVGRKLEEGMDWHYDIQHIGAQTRMLRSINQDSQIVVVYLEADKKSWPTWRRTRENSGELILSIIDHISETIPAKEKEIVLTGHSGGGSFTFGYLNALDEIPNSIKRIAFLDSNYGFSHEEGHGEKLHEWLEASENHYLLVLAYDDREVTYEGKKIVSETGGTWRATHRMKDSLSKWLQFQESDDEPYLNYAAPQIRMHLNRNPENKILHTVLVEMNGYSNAILEGTVLSEKAPSLKGPRAYSEFISDKEPMTVIPE